MYLQCTKQSEKCSRTCLTKCSAAICLRDTEWSYAEQLSQLWEEIDEVATRRRGEEVSKMVASLEVPDVLLPVYYGTSSLHSVSA